MLITCTDRQWNASATFLRGKSATFFYKEVATTLNNIVNQKYIIKSEWKRNYDVFS